MLARTITALLATQVVAPAAPAQQPPDNSGAREIRVYDISDIPSGVGLASLAKLSTIGLEFLSPSLLVVAAPPEEQDEFRDVLAQLRAVAPDHVGVSAVLHRVADASGLVVGAIAGDAITAAPAARRVDVAGARRTPLEMQSLDSFTYIQDVTPIVGQNSAALDPTLDLAHNGLKLEVIVGDAANGGSPVSLRGLALSASIAERRSPSAAAAVSAGQDGVDMIAITQRTLHADLVAPDARPVIAAIVDDPENPGAVLVLTITILPPS